MPFEHLVKCTYCGWIGSDRFEHEDCPEDPMKDPTQLAKAQEKDRKFEEWSELWDKWIEEHCSYNHGCFSVTYETPDNVAFEGKCILIDHGDSYWDGGEDVAEDYVSPLLDSPTWGDVFKRFQEAMTKTRDFHHCFLEGLSCEPMANGWPEAVLSHLKPGVRVLKFSTGS